ncbi:MAG: TlpA disulfide reductase family protein [Sporichthyaceae bacterium]
MLHSSIASNGRRLLRGVAKASVVGLVLFGCGAGGPGADAGPGFIEGAGTVTQLKPDQRGEPISMSGPKLGGGTLSLGDYRGKVVLLNVWGSWCAPCRKEAPDLEAAWQELKAQEVQFFGINTRDDAAGAAEAFERRFAITYPSFLDPDGSLQLTFRDTLPPKAIPSTLILDRQGRVAARVIGGTTRLTFVGLISEVLAEPV